MCWAVARETAPLRVQRGERPGLVMQAELAMQLDAQAAQE